MGYQKDQHELLLEFMDLLQNREKAEFVRLVTAWQSISQDLEAQIKRLSELKNISEDQLFRLELYKQFLEESRVIITVYNGIASEIILNEQEVFAKLGLQSAQELIGVNFSNRLNINDVKYMIGRTREGSGLFDILQESYPITVERITNTLIESMALGRGPEETARLLSEDMDGNLNRALLIARTEQISIFREAQTLQYKESGLVTAKEWLAEPDACELCLEKSANSPYPLDEVMDSHPNCRCAWLPIL
ncbi:MAG: hypothetical protein HRF52_14740 [Ignavibacterium sp.]|jgi:hypothetical protein|uniref:hypothetical protein n=1 Tax=Ignavibacterium sp. TaxID=2651167 RepID=UPI0032994045